MSYEAEREAVTGWFQTRWKDPTPVSYENVAFTQPSNAAFLIFTILNHNSNRRSLGGKYHLDRFMGEIQIDVYVPQNVGTKPSKLLVDQIVAIFNAANITATDGSDIQFQTPDSKNLGVSNALHRTVVSCPFYRNSFS